MQSSAEIISWGEGGRKEIWRSLYVNGVYNGSLHSSVMAKTVVSTCQGVHRALANVPFYSLF